MDCNTGKADMDRIAVLGHCMGGRTRYLAACTDHDYKAVVPTIAAICFLLGQTTAKGKRLTVYQT